MSDQPKMNCTDRLNTQIKLLEAENAKLKASHAELVQALDNILKHGELVAGKFGRMSTTSRIAQAALDKARKIDDVTDNI